MSTKTIKVRSRIEAYGEIDVPAELTGDDLSAFIANANQNGDLEMAPDWSTETALEVIDEVQLSPAVVVTIGMSESRYGVLELPGNTPQEAIQDLVEEALNYGLVNFGDAQDDRDYRIVTAQRAEETLIEDQRL